MQVRHTSVRWIAAFLCAVSAVCVLGLRTTAALGQSGETGLLTVDPKHNWTPQEVKDLPYEGVYSLREARQDWNNADKQQELGQDLRFYGTGTFIGPDLYRPKDQMVVLPIGPTFWMRELVAISEDFARYAELDYFTRPRGDWDMSIRVHWGLWEPMVSEHLAGVADAYPMAAYFGGYAARRTDIPREEKSEKGAACRYYRLMQYGNPNVRALLWEYPVSYDFVEVGSLEQALKIYEKRLPRIDAAVRDLADHMTAQYGNPPEQQVCILPSAQAEHEFFRLIGMRQFPGLGNLDGAKDHMMFTCVENRKLKDRGFNFHWPFANPGRKGVRSSQYLDALVLFSAVYGQPAMKLLARNPEQVHEKPTDAALQKIAWYALVSHPYSPVPPIVDDTPPAKCGPVDVVRSGRGFAELRWQESSDPESGVYKYLVTRSDGKKYEALSPELTDREVPAGQSCTYEVTAVNFAGLDDRGNRVWQRGNRNEVQPLRAIRPMAHTAAFQRLPAVKRVVSREDCQEVLVEFAQDVPPDAALNPRNYAVSGGIDVRAVVEGRNSRTFILKVSPLKPDEEYSLSVGGKPAARFRFERTAWKLYDNDVSVISVADVDYQGKAIHFHAAGFGMKSRRQLQDVRVPMPKPGTWAATNKIAVRYTMVHPRPGNEFVARYRDDLRGDFDFRIRVWDMRWAGRPALTGIVVANDFTDLAKGGYAYVGLAEKAGKMQVGYVGVKDSDSPDEINTVEETAFPGGPNALPLWNCWLRLKRVGDEFTAYYYADQQFDTFYTRGSIQDKYWVPLKSFKTLGTAAASQVGVFATANAETKNVTGNPSVVNATVQLGVDSWVGPD